MTIHHSCLLTSFSCRRSLPITLSNSSSSDLILVRAGARENTVEHLPLAPILALGRIDSRMKKETGIQPWISVPARFLARLGSGPYWNTWVPALLSFISMVWWFRHFHCQVCHLIQDSWTWKPKEQWSYEILICNCYIKFRNTVCFQMDSSTYGFWSNTS